MIHSDIHRLRDVQELLRASDLPGVSFSFWICLKTYGALVFLPESSACSPLSWLLSEYLDNAELVQRFKSRAAIFNSRVRRLTHLLVHVDTSQPDGEELKPPVKSSKSNATRTCVILS